MNRLIPGAIATMNSFLKLLSIKQVLIAALASFLLLSTTACGAGSDLKASSGGYKADPNAYKNSVNNEGTDYQRELYKPTQQPQGGMNNYNDDPQYGKKATKADAQRLVNRAERNLEQKAESPQELLKNVRDRNPLGQQARDASRNAGDVTEELKDDLSEGTQKGVQNLKRNIEQARQAVPKIVEEAKQNAQDAGKDAQSSAKDLSRGVQRATDRATDAVQDRAANTVDSVRNRN